MDEREMGTGSLLVGMTKQRVVGGNVTRILGGKEPDQVVLGIQLSGPEKRGIGPG